MKKAISLLLSAALLLGLLGACQPVSGPNPSASPSLPEAALTAKELAGLILPRSGCEDTDSVEYLNADEDEGRLGVYIEKAYGLTGWEDAAVIRAAGASAFEIAVVRFAGEDAAKDGAGRWDDYLYTREGDFTGYAPDQAELVANAAAAQNGAYAGLFICGDPEGAKAAFDAALSGEPLPDVTEPAVSAQPVQSTGPKFGLNDLMLRLLVEAACPEWQSSNSLARAWADAAVLDALKELVEEKYGVTPDQYKSCVAAIWSRTGGEFFYESRFPVTDYELAVFKTESEEGAEELAGALNDYLAEKEARLEQGSGESWEENALELVRNGQAAWSGQYAVLIVSDHTEEAIRLFPRAVASKDTTEYFRNFYNGIRPATPNDPDPDYPDRVRFVPPNEEDMSIYDTSAILAAWEEKDPGRLSEYDWAIYDAAQAVLEEILRDEMRGFEKEAAIYRWCVNNVDYDWTHQDIMAETSRDAFTPYGGLVNHGAVCLGYAACFQLLMDMAGMECITVVGASFESTVDHAWNMVRLDGDWYCVDPTWDANGREGPDGEAYVWRYFNLTSDEMAEDHQWDYKNTPEAVTVWNGRS